MRRIFRGWVKQAHCSNVRKVARIAAQRQVLVCRTGEGRVVTCMVDCTTIGHEVKQQLVRLLNVPVTSKMALVYQGTEVGDNQTLAFHNVRNNGIVDVLWDD